MRENVTDREPLVAVLIDADNVPAAHSGAIMAEIANLGTAALRRVYGDWSSSTVSPWREKIRTLGLNAIQKTANLKGKNATDLGIVIDAMDILHSKIKFDIFVIVSSDSDFTQLAGRIREDGRTVIGIGEDRTPVSLRNVCNRFILLENIIGTNNNGNKVDLDSELVSVSSSVSSSKAQAALPILMKCVLPHNEWGLLSCVGDKIHRIQPDFDCRSYGAKNLLELVRSFSDFDIDLCNNNHIIRVSPNADLDIDIDAHVDECSYCGDPGENSNNNSNNITARHVGGIRIKGRKRIRRRRNAVNKKKHTPHENPA